VQKALRSGVVHYGQTANPGQSGNVVIVGHSSGEPWTLGSYKYIFTLLNKVIAKDKIIIDYSGVRYIYEVIAADIVRPTDLSILEQPKNQFNLTLVTCTPVGTSKDRLIIHAKQTSPKPQLATVSPTKN
jgi:LPXTG-site transpeptidase (sortase) family protein